VLQVLHSELAMRTPLIRFCFSLPLLAALGGCQEPGYRTEAVGNGQGGVVIRRVPASVAPSAPAPVGESSASNGKAPTSDQRIRDLQEQVRSLNAEIFLLKEQLATRPATQP
jgi:hypothetical protein